MNGNQRKCKKKEKADRIADSPTAERWKELEDAASDALQERNALIEDVPNLVPKEGALLSVRAVETLVHEMCEEQSDIRPADLESHRMSFVKVIVATENEECLDRFVQLGGLHVLDVWLQEAHKGGEEAKASDELILMFLQALEKLRVDVDALKACPVGKSVNNLRTHSSVEVQKKAQRLVEMWKKRVDAEIKVSGEAKMGPMNGAMNCSKKNDTLRSGSQPVKVHATTSSKDISNIMKLKRTGGNEQVMSASLGEKEAVDVAQDDVSRHQKRVVSLPNLVRSPRSKGGMSSRASSMSSVDKHDEMAKNVAPDSCGDAISHNGIQSLCVLNLEHQVGSEHSRCQPDLYSGNVIGFSTLEAASEEGCNTNDVAMALSASLPASAGTQQERSQSHVESKLREGDLQGVDMLRLDRTVAMEATSDTRHTSSQRQVMEEKPLSSSPEHGSKAVMAQKEGLLCSASGINGCFETELAEDESGSSKEGCMSKQLTNNCILASSVEGCQTGIDSVAPDPEGCCEGATKTPSSTQGIHERVDAESRLYTPGYDEDYALAVARQVAMEVEQEVHGKLNTDSSSACLSETDSSSNACTKASKEEVNLTDTKHLDSDLQKGEDVDEDHDDMEMGNGGSITGDNWYDRPLFDLNEGLSTEEESVFQLVTEPAVTTVDTQIVAFPSSVAVPVAVVAAPKGPFIPLSDLLRSRGELGGGWKGSAATSAFRPAEPRHYVSDSGKSHSDTGSKRARMLEIDLNVADERGSESVDMVTSSGMDLDLNKTGEVEESAGPLSPCKISASSSHILRDFDLNDGIDIEGSVEQDLPQSKSVAYPSLPQYCINPMGLFVSSSNCTEPSVPTGVLPILKSSIQSLVTTDVFRSHASLSSNIPFMPNVSNGLPYSGFPFVSGFPATLSSSSILTSSVVTTPFEAPPVPLAGGTSYTKPYVVDLELDTGNAVSYTARPGFDLNAGPAGDVDVREGFLASAQGGPMKRNELEPYFDPFRSGCRQLV